MIVYFCTITCHSDSNQGKGRDKVFYKKESGDLMKIYLSQGQINLCIYYCTPKIVQCGSNRANNVDGAEVGFGCPTMQYSNQDVSRNNSVVMKTNHR